VQIQLADALQGVFQFAVVAQPLLDESSLFGGKADLFGTTARIGDGQNPDGMAGPWAQVAQPERWRMVRWSREPRRISVVKGSEAASWARASGVFFVCFILINENTKLR
jgi:hypothetical protein